MLKHIASTISATLRPTDLVGRYGGEEFLVGLPGCDLDGAGQIAERMRATLERTPFELEDGSRLGLTVSIGVASLEQRPSDLNELIRLSDQAVYAAKESGRNRVVLHSVTNPS